MIDKIEQYISSRKIYNRSCYQLTLEELRELKELRGNLLWRRCAWPSTMAVPRAGRRPGPSGGFGHERNADIQQCPVWHHSHDGDRRPTVVLFD